ncbi:class III extradiol dioxygenase subunit B-like domain-containing protein [Halostreptopolyspora alba]|uniref:Extradiol ring-cleavage dioxygenase class III enzyme subunit B domain-containing protein n=1 Tax=Halostreptopolyspora alba TaxID=2487137 RepID=A0A3N0EE75_9ACTN|nr:hypothetical protein EFW17_06565 [Nocardiopsaceae bacterium YIM 96095]
MFVAAAVCPHPPVLVPELAGGAAHELATVRDACDRAVAGLADAGAEEIVVVGAGEHTRTYGAGAGGSLAGFGVDLMVGSPPAVLPLSLTLGRWLAERAGVEPSRYVAVPPDTSPAECLARGVTLASEPARLGILVMGDGSARRTEHAPGPHDPRAVPFDRSVATALAKADTAALAELGPGVATELMAAGRPAWQVLAGAARGAVWHGELLAHEAPYGVGYFVALWRG